MPQLLCTLLHRSPWQVKRNGFVWRFEDGNWVKLNAKPAPLSDTDKQMWAVLIMLLMGKCDVGYEHALITPMLRIMYLIVV